MIRMFRIIVAFVAVIAGAWADDAADPASTVASTVSQAIQHLESLNAAERAAGLKTLQELGASALSTLPEDLSAFTPATRDALAQLRNQWERDLATASLQPSHFELMHEASRSLSAVAAVIQADTGNVVVFDKSLPSERVAQVAGGFTFWSGVNHLEALTDSRCVWRPEVNRFAFLPHAESTPLPMFSTGAARLILESNRLKPLPDGKRSQLLRTELRLQVEPRLRPLFVQVKLRDWSGAAIDQAITPWNPPAVLELPFPDGGSEVVFPVDLLWPANASGPWSLSGDVTVHYTARWDTVAFDGPALSPGNVKRRGGVSVRLRAAEFQPAAESHQRARIRIVVNYDQGDPAFESHRAGLFHRSARLIHRDGSIYPADSFDVAAEADGSMMLEYLFDELPGRPIDYRFEYAAPTQLLDVSYPVRFRDLPAPSSPGD